MFRRADNRQRARKESKRADWVFDRANDRKQFHKMGDADWSSKRLFNKKCTQGSDGEDVECENLGEVSTFLLTRQSTGE